MPRNDSMLYSGMASPKKRQIEEQKADEPKLDRDAAAVLDELKKMKTDVLSVERVVIDDTLTEEAKLRRIERMRGDYDLLLDLEKRMKRILGVK